MRYIILLSLALAFTNAFSQTQITINGNPETVYPIIENEAFTASEIKPLREIFISKKIAGFGESTHGTHEFYTTRLQFLKFLVSECGYRTVALESGYGIGLFVNDFVRDGKGNIDSAVHKLDFWMYRFQEARDLLQWLRNYNSNKKEDEKVSFYGFDMQTFYPPIQYLDQEINAFSFNGKDEFNRIIQVIKDNRSENYKTIAQLSDKTVPEKLMNAYEELKKWFSANGNDLGKLFPEKKKKQLELCVEDFKMAVLNSRFMPGFRDSCMSVVAGDIQKIENSGIMLYGHMGHLGRQEPSGSNMNVMYKSMGAHLKDKYGTSYYPVGLIFSEGEFTAFEDKKENRKLVLGPLKEFKIKDDKRHVLSGQFSKAGINSFFIPFTQRPHAVFFKYAANILHSTGFL